MQMSERRRRSVAKILLWRIVDDAIRSGAWCCDDPEMERELKHLAVRQLPETDGPTWYKAEADHGLWQKGELR